MKWISIALVSGSGVFTLYGCATHQYDRALIKEEIRWDILDELRAREKDDLRVRELKLKEEEEEAAEDRRRMKAEIKREILSSLSDREKKALSERAASSKERRGMKAEIKREIYEELRAKGIDLPEGQALAGDERTRVKKELELEIMARLRKAGIIDYPALGSAEGRILLNKKGLEGCAVELVKMSSAWKIGHLFGSYHEGPEFFSTTDEDGKYYFEEIPVGDYKIKWKLPGEKDWIRRLKIKPDVTIEEGKTSILNPVDAGRPLVPR